MIPAAECPVHLVKKILVDKSGFMIPNMDIPHEFDTNFLPISSGPPLFISLDIFFFF